MKKIILDTDIGSDIDDALALSYLLREPACELLGITTVSGEPVLRAELASAIPASLARFSAGSISRMPRRLKS